MSQLPCLSISQFNTTIKQLLEEELALDDVWITGELSNIKHYQQGKQIYFTLSDKQSSLNSFMYDTTLSRLDFSPQPGQHVYARGRIRFFQKRGQFMFQANYLSLEGSGVLSQQFEQLKQQLLDEGLFDPSRKKPLPHYPHYVGVITAYDSAAMWDFLRVSHARAPHLKTTVIPAVMQGLSSPPSVIEALTLADTIGFDCLVLTRGGGSAEDLACFNHEGLVRCIANLRTPLLSAIGHEVDITLCDFVADLRCATPTASAQELCSQYTRFRHRTPDRLQALFTSMETRLRSSKADLLDSIQQGSTLIHRRLTHTQHMMQQLNIRLTQANPLHKLKQGFSICRLDETQAVVKSVDQVKPGDILSTQVTDGTLQSQVM